MFRPRARLKAGGFCESPCRGRRCSGCRCPPLLHFNPEHGRAPSTMTSALVTARFGAKNATSKPHKCLCEPEAVSKCSCVYVRCFGQAQITELSLRLDFQQKCVQKKVCVLCVGAWGNYGRPAQPNWFCRTSAHKRSVDAGLSFLSLWPPPI